MARQRIKIAELEPEGYKDVEDLIAVIPHQYRDRTHIAIPFRRIKRFAEPLQIDAIRTTGIDDIIKQIEPYKSQFDRSLMLIDLKANDYWVWKAICGLQKRGRYFRLVCIRFNPFIPIGEKRVAVYDPDCHYLDGKIYYSASLSALHELGNTLGYQLVHRTRDHFAIFVHNDVADRFVIPTEATLAHIKYPGIGEVPIPEKPDQPIHYTIMPEC